MSRKIILYCLGLLFLASCTGMNDIIEEYLDAGETVYIAKVDSLKSYAGKERILFSWMVGIDSRIEACKITWNNNSDSIIHQIDRNKVKEDGMYEMFLPVAEGNYVFNLYHIGSGPQSVPNEIIANSYGEIYQNNLMARSITDTKAEQNQVEMNFSDGSLSLFSQFRYTNQKGEEKVVKMDPKDDKLVIKDYMCDGEYAVETSFLPEKTAVDTFRAVTKGRFPAFYELNREGWTAWSSSIQEGAFPPSNAIDGDDYTLWHSAYDPSDPLPHDFIVDMQSVKFINEIYFLRDPSRRHTKKANVLISKDNTTWSEVGIIEFFDKANVPKVLKLEKVMEARYVKFHITESFTPPFGDAAEIKVYGR